MPLPDLALNLTRRIDLVSLRLFAAVCEAGSIGRAAELENMAPSAVSKRVSELEAALAVPLLARHSRGVTLTPAGESLLHHARALLYGLERLQGELADHAAGVRGHVRVHATISAILEFLPEDLGAFARSHPDVKIDLQESHSAGVLDAVRQGTADLGICLAPAEGAAHDVAGTLRWPWRSDRLVLAVPQGHALCDRGAVAFADALAFDFVGLPAATSIGTAMRQAAAAAGRPLVQRIQTQGLDAMCRMIDAGLGIGCLPDRAFALLQGLGRLAAVPLTDAWADRTLQLVVRDGDALPTAPRLLLAHLEAAARGDSMPNKAVASVPPRFSAMDKEATTA